MGRSAIPGAETPVKEGTSEGVDVGSRYRSETKDARLEWETLSVADRSEQQKSTLGSDCGRCQTSG